MKSYIVATRYPNSLDSVVAVANNRRRAERLVNNLEEEDKYLGLYEPNRYEIFVGKDYETVREIVRT